MGASRSPSIRNPQSQIHNWLAPATAATHNQLIGRLVVAGAIAHRRLAPRGLRLATELTAWPAVNGERIAAVSAFGMSGTNTHAVVAIPDTAGQAA